MIANFSVVYNTAIDTLHMVIFKKMPFHRAVSMKAGYINGKSSERIKWDSKRFLSNRDNFRALHASLHEQAL